MLELTQELLIFIAIIVIAQLTLVLFALNDLRKQNFENKIVWLIIILLASTIGPILYFLAAPRESSSNYFDEEEEVIV